MRFAELRVRGYISTMNKHEPLPEHLNVESGEARRLALELSELTGESLEDAVTLALQIRLAAERHKRWKPGEVAEKLLEFGRWYSQFPEADNRTLEEVLGYDDVGLPT